MAKSTSAWSDHRAGRHEEILERAAALFAEVGYEAVSLNELAERLGMTKPSLYYYFKSKDDILHEIKRRAQHEIFEVIDRAAEAVGTGLDRMEILVRGYIGVMASDFGRCLITVKRRSLDRGSRKRIEGRDKEAEGRIIDLFKAGMDDGSIRHQDVKIAYQALFGMLSWIAVWYKDRGPVKRDEMIAQVVSLMFDGIRAA